MGVGPSAAKRRKVPEHPVTPWNMLSTGWRCRERRAPLTPRAPAAPPSTNRRREQRPLGMARAREHGGPRSPSSGREHMRSLTADDEEVDAAGAGHTQQHRCGATLLDDGRVRDSRLTERCAPIAIDEVCQPGSRLRRSLRLHRRRRTAGRGRSRGPRSPPNPQTRLSEAAHLRAPCAAGVSSWPTATCAGARWYDARVAPPRSDGRCAASELMCRAAERQPVEAGPPPANDDHIGGRLLRGDEQAPRPARRCAPFLRGPQRVHPCRAPRIGRSARS